MLSLTLEEFKSDSAVLKPDRTGDGASRCICGLDWLAKSAEVNTLPKERCAFSFTRLPEKCPMIPFSGTVPFSMGRALVWDGFPEGSAAPLVLLLPTGPRSPLLSAGLRPLISK